MTYDYLIKPLPTDVINLIAAGEVIDSIAAGVRELIENALDAKATRITIAVSPQQWRVRVADNGYGMEKVDLLQAATPHSTSKIHNSQDLRQIQSLGFRGEALHSLAQLAQLEIFSRPLYPDCSTPYSPQQGWRVLYDCWGEAVQVDTVAIAPGTIVIVSDLFRSWQNRRQALPNPQHQLKAIQRTIYDLALCHPHVTWKVEQNDQPWFTITPGQTAQAIIPQLLPNVRLSDLQFTQQSVENEQALELVIGLPDRCHRKRSDWVKVAVNGRVVSVPELEQTLLVSLAKTIPRDRYPLCFAHLNVSPHAVDWNRQPAKTQIYLHELKLWQTQIQQAVEQALRITPANLPEAYQQFRVTTFLQAAEPSSPYRSDPPEDKPDSQPLIELQAIAQIRKTYIIAEHPNGFWLVEQHIAHERILYEQLCQDWRLVALQTPVILEQLSGVQLEQLTRLGLEIEPFGEQLWAVRNSPEPLAEREDCAQALIEISRGDLQAAQVAIACRTAIRNGTALTLIEMQQILDQWIQTRNPRTCPHGRPIYMALEESSLAKFFRRHWVIGKSHGI